MSACVNHNRTCVVTDITPFHRLYRHADVHNVLDLSPHVSFPPPFRHLLTTEYQIHK